MVFRFDFSRSFLRRFYLLRRPKKATAPDIPFRSTGMIHCNLQLLLRMPAVVMSLKLVIRTIWDYAFDKQAIVALLSIAGSYVTH